MNINNTSSMSSNNFRANNKILFEAKVGAELRVGRYPDHEPDVIDLNGNNAVDYKEKHSLFGTKTNHIYEEPTLENSFVKIKNFAKANEIEIVTQNEIKDVNIKTVTDVNGHSKYGYPIRLKKKSNNTRSISELIKKETPYNPDAKWAFDTKNNSFIIYEPKNNDV